LEILFTGESHETLSLFVLGRTHPNSTEYWDANWLTMNVRAELGAFKGNVSGDIQTSELVCFQKDLKHFYQTLKGTVSFQTLEEWIMINLEASKLGQIKITGFVKDGYSFGNRNVLYFTLETDQTFLLTPMNQLQQAISTFPVIGQP
jgi:hypothetical protein